jgi:cation transport ATPase
VAEIPGEGVVGHVEGRKVIVGGDAFVASRVGRRPGDHSAMPPVGPRRRRGRRHMAGHLVMSDPLRAGAGAMLDGLRREGIARILLATGDRAAWPSA